MKNNNIYYKGLTGSCLFGINLANSDIDYIAITKTGAINCIETKQDIFCHTPKTFITFLFEHNDLLLARLLFLTLFSKPVILTEFSEYILENREKLMRSNLSRFGQILYIYIQTLSNLSKGEIINDKINPKKTVYALIFSNAYIRYATEDITFEQALILPEELKLFIMDIRNGKISDEEQRKIRETIIQKIDSVKTFYDQEPDLDTFYRIKKEMMALLDI